MEIVRNQIIMLSFRMEFIHTYGLNIIEFCSAILILLGFEFFNRKNINGFYIMAAGQLFAAGVCSLASLWFLAFMHFVNFLMQIRGYYKWVDNKKVKPIQP